MWPFRSSLRLLPPVALAEEASWQSETGGGGESHDDLVMLRRRGWEEEDTMLKDTPEVDTPPGVWPTYDMGVKGSGIGV
jgi:hypothetical protein